jgi:hypothetical protein
LTRFDQGGLQMRCCAVHTDSKPWQCRVCSVVRCPALAVLQLTTGRSCGLLVVLCMRAGRDGKLAGAPENVCVHMV